ncbi:MAG: hypothetical protein WBM13_05320 [Bacteroidia bacterium]
MITKKAFSFVLLAIFLFNIVGYFIAFKIVQHKVRSEVKTAIKQTLTANQLTVIEIYKTGQNQLIWKEKNKEFYYKGELYDIVKTEEKTESIIYYCINDKQEEQLFEHLEEHVNNYMSENHFSKKSSSKKNHFDSIKLYLSNVVALTLATITDTTTFNTYSLLYTSSFIEISTPPPKIG